MSVYYDHKDRYFESAAPIADLNRTLTVQARQAVGDLVVNDPGCLEVILTLDPRLRKASQGYSGYGFIASTSTTTLNDKVSHLDFRIEKVSKIITFSIQQSCIELQTSFLLHLHLQDPIHKMLMIDLRLTTPQSNHPYNQ